AILIGFLLCIAGFGVTVATGLIRRRNWARISAIVWAVFMSSMGALALLIGLVLLVRSPHEGSLPVRVFFLTIYAAFFTTGIWWLLLFTRRSIVDEFAGLAAEAAVMEDVSVPAASSPFKILR